MERVVPVLFVLQNSFAFICHVLSFSMCFLTASYVLSLLCFVALPNFT